MKGVVFKAKFVVNYGTTRPGFSNRSFRQSKGREGGLAIRGPELGITAGPNPIGTTRKMGSLSRGANLLGENALAEKHLAQSIDEGLTANTSCPPAGRVREDPF